MSDIRASQAATTDLQRLLQRGEVPRERPDAPSLQSVLSAAALKERPSRPSDLAAENRALVALAEAMVASPAGILQKLAETALTLCGAHSAGVSLLTEDGKSFFWPAVAGQLSPHLGGGTPRDFGPCGTVLDRNSALLFSHPERDFPYLADVKPLLEEGLLIPFYINGEAVGTIWVISHEEGRRFDAEDLRVMTNLSTFAAAAYQTSLALNAAQRIASIVEGSDDAILSEDLNGGITSWNHGAERLYGYSADEVIGKSIAILLPPEQQDEEIKILECIRRSERVEHCETIRIHKKGSRVEVSLTVSPIKNAEGMVVGASKIARDITERKRTEAQITNLANEAEHRAKNVLAVMQAMVHLSQADTAQDLKDAIEGRIQALANVHTLFVRSRWVGAELRNLIEQELLPYAGQGGACTLIDGPPVLLNREAAQTIAVAMHELATNAVKYGALSVAAGLVRIEWSRAADGKLLLQWTEEHGPAVHAPTRKGFGTRVIESMVRSANGEVRLDWRAEGFACRITMPI
jgi:PAS domain S-box-containing protein